MIEHVAKKCSIPKNIKLFWFKKKVVVVITKQIKTNTPERFKNFIVKLSELCASLEDMADIMIKLAPMHCAINKGIPCVIVFSSIKLK